MKTAVIYARFSCSKQREASIEDQTRECRLYAERNGYEVIAEYCDHATSGRTDKRPEFQKMILNAGEADAVIVYAMDRFSRDPYDAPMYKHTLKKKDCIVLSATERITDSPEGMLLEKVIEGVAAMESAHNSIRTKRGMEGNARKCQWNGNKIFGYGVGDDKRYVIDEEQAVFVREAFARRLNGEAPAAIAADFALRGVKTYTGRPCSPSMVENMLRNERYTGLYKWGDIEVEDGMPSIISKQTFDAVGMAPRAKRRKEETWRNYALAGKSVCMCGHNLVGKSATGNGGKYSYYTCGGKCGQVRPVRADWLEDSIYEAIQTVLSDENELLRIASLAEQEARSSEAMAKLDAARKAKADAEKTLDNLIEAMKRGVCHPSMQSEIDIAMERKERAERDILLLETQADKRFNVEHFKQFIKFALDMDRKRVLNIFVGQVVLMPHAIAVTLNYEDKENAPAYLEIDWCAETDSGSPLRELCAPYATIVRGMPVIVVPRAA